MKVSKICGNLGLVKPGVPVSKASLPLVISHAMDQTTPANMKEAFRRSRIYPVDRSQISNEVRTNYYMYYYFYLW